MRIVPTKLAYTRIIRLPAPQAIGLARGIGQLYGRGINGQTGAVRYGYPTFGARSKFLGYANSPQLFRGYSPAKVAGGSFRGSPGALPSTNGTGTFPLNSPLQNSMAYVTLAQMQGKSR